MKSDGRSFAELNVPRVLTGSSDCLLFFVHLAFSQTKKFDTLDPSRTTKGKRPVGLGQVNISVRQLDTIVSFGRLFRICPISAAHDYLLRSD